MAELSDKARKLFEDPNILFVATVNVGRIAAGHAGLDARRRRPVTFNTAKGRVKERNMRRDPRIGLLDHRARRPDGRRWTSRDASSR